MPLARLACVARTPLFERSLSLYEELADERGDKYRHVAGRRDMDANSGTQVEGILADAGRPLQSDTLFLETENGDNPPIELEKFTAFYPATRMLFKAKPGDDCFFITAIRTRRRRVMI